MQNFANSVVPVSTLTSHVPVAISKTLRIRHFAPNVGRDCLCKERPEVPKSVARVVDIPTILMPFIAIVVTRR